MGNIELRDKNNLPATREELAQFVLVGREALNAVRAKIRAIDKAGLAKDVYEQKLAEGQDVAEAVLDAEVRLGELFSEIPKAHGGGWGSGNLEIKGAQDSKSKMKEVDKLGFSQYQSEQFQKIAKHPEAVEIAKKEARNNNKLVSRSLVHEVINVSKKTKRSEPNTELKKARTINCPNCGLEIEVV